jgi:Helix-turn-helix domain
MSGREVVMYPDGRMDPKSAAAYVGLSEKTLAMKRCAGTGPKFVKRGRVFYFKEDLDEWLRAGRAASTAQAASLTV